MLDDLSERLFAHFVAGRWRVPFATRAHPVFTHAGQHIGQIVPAGPEDIARAYGKLRATDSTTRCRLADAVERGADDLAQAILIQTGSRPARDEMRNLARYIADAPLAESGLVLCSHKVEGARLGHALGAGVMGGMIWCPPPQDAIFATEFARIAQNADLPPGAFALLHARMPETEAALRATGLPVIAA